VERPISAAPGLSSSRAALAPRGGDWLQLGAEQSDRLGRIACLVVIFTAVFVLASWAFALPLVWMISPGKAVMQPSTALCFLLLGLAILARFRSMPPRRAVVTPVIASVLLAYSLALLLDYGSPHAWASLGWLFPDVPFGEHGVVGLMSPTSAVNFGLLATALLLQDRPWRGLYPTEALALGTLVLPLLTALGNVFAYDILYELVAYSSMAIGSSLLFGLAVLAFLRARPDRPLARLLFGDSTGGQMTRRLLPIVFFLPLLLGWLRWKAQQWDWFDLGFGLALNITLSVGIMVAVVLVMARWVDREASARLEAISALAENEARLHRVLQLQQSLLQQRLASDDSINAVLAQVAETVAADGAVLEFIEGDAMVYRFASGSLAPFVGLRLGFAQSLSGKVAREGGSALCLDTASDPRVDAAACRRAGVGSMVLAVLPGPEESRVVLKAVAARAHAFGEADRMAIQLLAATVSASLARISYESQIAARTTELERSNAELQRFAYVASHDLQEPLRMVTSYLELIEKRYAAKLDQDGHEFIRYAVDGAARMKKLIADLLSFSRVGTRGRPLLPVDPDSSLDRALANLQLQVGETGARIERTPLPRVVADADQLVQLFQNLVSNALKYRGGRPPVVRISAAQEGGIATFAVADNGLGIEPQYFERIFIIFQRLHADPKISGTGIGLALCKKIVERHGGRIWVESTPGQGSTFHFTLSVTKD